MLSVEDVEELLRCTRNLKQRTFLMTLYAAGLRLAEAAALRIPDIDSRRMQLNVAEILKRTAAQYVECYPRQAVPQVQSALAKLSLCRTAALGARHYQCEGCQDESFIYNSCGDRHCPTCRGARRADCG